MRSRTKARGRVRSESRITGTWPAASSALAVVDPVAGAAVMRTFMEGDSNGLRRSHRADGHLLPAISGPARALGSVRDTLHGSQVRFRLPAAASSLAVAAHASSRPGSRRAGPGWLDGKIFCRAASTTCLAGGPVHRLRELQRRPLKGVQPPARSPIRCHVELLISQDPTGRGPGLWWNDGQRDGLPEQ
jgi:hypothetical protein